MAQDQKNGTISMAQVVGKFYSLGKVVAHQFGFAHHIAATAASRWYLLLEIIPQIIVTLIIRFILADCLGIEIFDVETVSDFSNSAIFVSNLGHIYTEPSD
jgi:hypothetical protein